MGEAVRAELTNFEDFLGWAVDRWPEESFAMTGLARACVEAPQTERHPNSWAEKMFPGSVVDHREFDRAALGLLCMWTLWKEKSLGSLGVAQCPYWRDTLVKTMAMPGGFEAVAYATLFKDLGKLDSSVEALKSLGLPAVAGHDEVLALALKACPEKVAPGSLRLQGDWAKVWARGLSARFNVGMAASMELPRAGWSTWRALAPEMRSFHALHSYFSFLGDGGAVDPVKPVARTASHQMSELFAMACMGGPAVDFEEELSRRRGWESPGRPALALACMARAHAVGATTRAQSMIETLCQEDRVALEWALGASARVAWQHAPALIAAGSGSGLGALSSAEGLEVLEVLASRARELMASVDMEEWLAEGRDVGVADMGEMARLRKTGDVKWKSIGRWIKMTGGWTWAPA